MTDLALAEASSTAAPARESSPATPSSGLPGLWLPPDLLKGRLTVSDADRDRGLFVRAGSGSGKSVFLGRIVCFQDFLRGIPQVIIDPMGALAENLFLQIALLPIEVRERLWPRLIYVDMSGGGDRVVPFPLLFQMPGESLTDVADRFLEALRKIDPHLQGASIQGWNALVRVGRPALMALAALGKPISAAADLLRRPESWFEALDEAAAHAPELHPALAYLRDEYAPLRSGERLTLAGSFLVKIAPFTLDPVLRDMFCTTRPGIDLTEVSAGRKTVVLDLRDETNVERRRFKTRWIYEWFLAYVKQRAPGQHMPFGFTIDELTELTNQVSLGQDLFARDIDALVNFHGRNRKLFLAFATQEMFALSPETQKTLLTMGTQVHGLTADMESAKLLAEQFFALDPYRVKRVENIWGGSLGVSIVVEEREAFMPVDEQILLAAQELLALRPFEFLVKKRHGRRLAKISARALVDGRWPSDHPEAMAYIRHHLSRRAGVPREALAGADSLLPTTHDALGTMGSTIHDASDDTVYITDDRDDAEDWATPPLW